MKKTFFILPFLILNFINLIAQKSIYLSQPFISAQYLSPASVGTGIYDQRVQSNFKYEIFGISNIKTIVGGWDRRININSENGNYVGIGAQLMSDQFDNGVLSNNYLTFNAAYHLFIDEESEKSLAIGLGGTFAQTSIDAAKITFGNEFDFTTSTFNRTNRTELLRKFPSQFSANTGILFTKHTNNLFLQVGASGFFYGPAEVIQTSVVEASGVNASVFTNFEKVFENDQSLLVHGSFNNQKNYNEYFFGASYSLPFNTSYSQTKRLYFGLYHRWQIAYVPLISLIIDQYNFGLSYDFFTSGLSAANFRQSAFELTFSKSFGQKREQKMRTLFD